MTQRLDSHTHLWDPAHRRCPWWTDEVRPIQRTFSLADLEVAMQPHGFEQAIVVEAFADTQESLELLRLASESSAVAGVVGWADLTSPDVRAALDCLAESPGGSALVGLRHPVHDERDAEWLMRADVLRGLEAVADAGLTFDLLVRTREMPAASRLAARLPSLRLVLDHLGKPPIAAGDDGQWTGALDALAAQGNVSCKLSGLVTEALWRRWRAHDLARYIDRALDAFGPDRLMFGSDWPVCLLSATYSQVVDVVAATVGGLTAAETDSVFGGTARRVYHLGEPE